MACVTRMQGQWQLGFVLDEKTKTERLVAIDLESHTVI